jgi:hypothetical protein
MRIIVCLFSILALSVCGQIASNTISLEGNQIGVRHRLPRLNFMPPAYKKEGLRLVIQEANQVAQELHLSEDLPITENKVIESFISPPGILKIGFGNITTSNYVYFVTVGDKLSFLTRANLKREEQKLRAQYLLPMNKMDTNAAYQLATQWLAAVSMDVVSINQNCNVHVEAFIPEGKNGKHFTPIYWVYWLDKKAGSRGGVSVELCLPNKTLLQLRVNKSEYILRPPLMVTNLDFLLTQTNAATGTNAPGSSPR